MFTRALDLIYRCEQAENSAAANRESLSTTQDNLIVAESRVQNLAEKLKDCERRDAERDMHIKRQEKESEAFDLKLKTSNDRESLLRLAVEQKHGDWARVEAELRQVGCAPFDSLKTSAQLLCVLKETNARLPSLCTQHTAANGHQRAEGGRE